MSAPIIVNPVPENPPAEPNHDLEIGTQLGALQERCNHLENLVQEYQSRNVSTEALQAEIARLEAKITELENRPTEVRIEEPPPDLSGPEELIEESDIVEEEGREEAEPEPRKRNLFERIFLQE